MKAFNHMRQQRRSVDTTHCDQFQCQNSVTIHADGHTCVHTHTARSTCLKRFNCFTSTGQGVVKYPTQFYQVMQHKLSKLPYMWRGSFLNTSSCSTDRETLIVQSISLGSQAITMLTGSPVGRAHIHQAFDCSSSPTTTAAAGIMTQPCPTFVCTQCVKVGGRMSAGWPLME